MKTLGKCLSTVSILTTILILYIHIFSTFNIHFRNWITFQVKNFGTMEYGGEKHDDFEFPAVLVADKYVF